MPAGDVSRVNLSPCVSPPEDEAFWDRAEAELEAERAATPDVIAEAEGE